MTLGSMKRCAALTMAAVSLLAVGACSSSKKADTGAASPEVTSSPATSASTTSTSPSSTGTSIPTKATGDTVQWAVAASATTSYGSAATDSWSAQQATGAPDVTAQAPDLACGDIGQAWASAARDTVDTLTLGYAKAVVPTGVVVRETYNPGAIVKIEVSGPSGQRATVYQGQPSKVEECPRMFEVDITDVSFPVNSVAITLDQTQVQNWSEIDAVQLIGNLPPAGA